MQKTDDNLTKITFDRFPRKYQDLPQGIFWQDLLRKIAEVLELKDAKISNRGTSLKADRDIFIRGAGGAGVTECSFSVCILEGIEEEDLREVFINAYEILRKDRSKIKNLLFRKMLLHLQKPQVPIQQLSRNSILLRLTADQFDALHDAIQNAPEFQEFGDLKLTREWKDKEAYSELIVDFRKLPKNLKKWQILSLKTTIESAIKSLDLDLGNYSIEVKGVKSVDY